MSVQDSSLFSLGQGDCWFFFFFKAGTSSGDWDVKTLGSQDLFKNIGYIIIQVW